MKTMEERILSEGDKYVGSINLKEEFERLKIDAVDLNTITFKQKMEKYSQLNLALEATIRNTMEKIAETEKKIRNIESNPNVRGKVWRGNIWYDVSNHLKSENSTFIEVISFMAWQSIFRNYMFEKSIELIDGYKGPAQEQIRLETIKNTFGDLMTRQEKFYETMMKERASADGQRLDRVIQLAGLKDGVEIKKRDEKIRDLDKQILEFEGRDKELEELEKKEKPKKEKVEEIPEEKPVEEKPKVEKKEEFEVVPGLLDIKPMDVMPIFAEQEQRLLEILRQNNKLKQKEIAGIMKLTEPRISAIIKSIEKKTKKPINLIVKS